MNDYRHQVSNTTAYNRYPRVFRRAAETVARISPPGGVRVLSYGCSTGEEAHCLATMYFKEATVIGLDVSPRVLDAARANYADPRIIYDLSTPANLAAHGPYHCITAMSVLCRWPDSENLSDISHLYTFDQFDRAVSELDANLVQGGALVIFNANFNFLDTATAARYEVVRVAADQHNGYVHRFDRDNKRIQNYAENDCVYRKLAASV
jgi:SAM-dependent methyltransferase